MVLKDITQSKKNKKSSKTQKSCITAKEIKKEHKMCSNKIN